MPQFSTRNPARPEFWDERFAAGHTPWDAQGVPPAFARWLTTLGPGAGRRVLVPGCGSAWEVAALDAAGFSVLAVDYAPAAIARARAVLGPALSARSLRLADVFTLEEPPFDLVYERAFLAALPPPLWPQWGATMARLTAVGGTLAGFFFVDPRAADPRRGPPFAVTPTELSALLDAGFAPREDAALPARESAAVFAGRERWCSWRRY